MSGEQKSTIVSGGGTVKGLELNHGRVKVTCEGGLTFDVLASDAPALGSHVTVRAEYRPAKVVS